MKARITLRSSVLSLGRRDLISPLTDIGVVVSDYTDVALEFSLINLTRVAVGNSTRIAIDKLKKRY